MMRGRIKSVAEATLLRWGVAGLARRLSPRRVYVLAYHNVVPEGAEVVGDASLHLPQRHFAEQLDLIQETCDVVPLDALLDSAAQDGGRPRVAITCDDAYRGAVTVGVDELALRALPVTIFVAPALVGANAYWWDALAVGGALSESLRRRALEDHRGEDSAVRRWAESQQRPLEAPGAFAAPASEAELAAALRHPGITLASHTWSHPNLTRLSAAEVEDELRRSLRWLRERFTRVIPWLSYPYGLSSPDVQNVVAGTGYVAAVANNGGGFRAPPIDAYVLPRLNVPAGLSTNGLALRLTGLVTR